MEQIEADALGKPGLDFQIVLLRFKGIREGAINPVLVVVTADEVYMLANDLFTNGIRLFNRRAKRKVSQDVEGIARTHTVVDIRKEAPIHLLNRREWTMRELDNIRVPKVRICREPHHGASPLPCRRIQKLRPRPHPTGRAGTRRIPYLCMIEQAEIYSAALI